MEVSSARGMASGSPRFIAVVATASALFFLACGLMTITHRDRFARDMLTNFQFQRQGDSAHVVSREEQTRRILKMIAAASREKQGRGELPVASDKPSALSTLLKSRILEPLKDKLVQTSLIRESLWGLKIKGPIQLDQIKPTTCVTRGRCRVTIYGKNMGVPGRFNSRVARRHISITVGQTECHQMLWYNERKIKCLVGRGFGGNLNVTMEITGQPFGEIAVLQGGFAYEAPDISKLDPDSLTIGQSEWINIKGFNFGQTDTSPKAKIGGISCNETLWKNDASIMCLAPPVHSLSIQALVVDVQGQNQTAHVPVKKRHIPAKWPFDELTYDTEPWKITVAAMADRTPFKPKWFEEHSHLILEDTGKMWADLKRHHLSDEEALAVQMFRSYLNEHFNANKTHLQNIDGVYVKDEGSKLTGNVKHDKASITKQVQLLEAETGDTITELAPLVGDIVKQVPTCAGYPDCENSESAGHRGWTWHWHYSDKRGWKWVYREIAEGDQPPTSCPFCDPPQIHKNHSLNFTKARMEYCFHCSNNSFANLLQPGCSTFRDMCLQSKHNGSRVAFAQSNPDVDPPISLARAKSSPKMEGVNIAAPSGGGGGVSSDGGNNGGEGGGGGGGGNSGGGGGDSGNASFNNGGDGANSNGTGAGGAGGGGGGVEAGGNGAGEKGGGSAGGSAGGGNASSGGEGSGGGGPTRGGAGGVGGDGGGGGESGGVRGASVGNGGGGNGGVGGAGGGGVGGVGGGSGGAGAGGPSPLGVAANDTTTWRYSAKYQMTKWMDFLTKFLVSGKDRFVHVKSPSTIAEYSPEQFIDIREYPSARIPGGVGPAGNHIRDADVLIFWLVGFIAAIWIALLIFVYNRVMFISEAEYERLEAGSDFDDDLDALVFVEDDRPIDGSRAGSPISQGSV